jgi:LysM repeat protein
MPSDPRGILLAGTVAVLLVGVLIASAVINATSGGTTPDLTSPAALRTATRSLPAYWVIKPGETYDTIAAETHLSVSQLVELNPAQDPNSLVPGERLALHLPTAHQRAARRNVPRAWTVGAGDTYSSIARRTGVPVYDIAAFNPNVNPDLLRPGQHLKLRH